MILPAIATQIHQLVKVPSFKQSKQPVVKKSNEPNCTGKKQRSFQFYAQTYVLNFD